MDNVISVAAMEAAKIRRENRMKNIDASNSFTTGAGSGGSLALQEAKPAADSVEAVSAPKRTRQASTVASTVASKAQSSPIAATSLCVTRPTYLLTEDMVKVVLQMNLKELEFVADAMQVPIYTDEIFWRSQSPDDDASAKKKTTFQLKSELIRYTGTSDAPTFEPTSNTFEFPNLTIQDFQQPAALTSA